jgi:hypothetical protein
LAADVFLERVSMDYNNLAFNAPPLWEIENLFSFLVSHSLTVNFLRSPELYNYTLQRRISKLLQRQLWILFTISEVNTYADFDMRSQIWQEVTNLKQLFSSQEITKVEFPNSG